MSDRIPGSSWDNPIWHGKWRICVNDFTAHPKAWTVAFGYSHDDFDGAPDADDHRYGYAPTVEACKAQIDAYEEEHADAV